MQQYDAVGEGHQSIGSSVRCQYFQRVGLKGEYDGTRVVLFRGGFQGSDDFLMPSMNTIEYATGQTDAVKPGARKFSR